MPLFTCILGSIGAFAAVGSELIVPSKDWTERDRRFDRLAYGSSLVGMGLDAALVTLTLGLIV